MYNIRDPHNFLMILVNPNTNKYYFTFDKVSKSNDKLILYCHPLNTGTIKKFFSEVGNFYLRVENIRSIIYRQEFKNNNIFEISPDDLEIVLLQNHFTMTNKDTKELLNKYVFTKESIKSLGKEFGLSNYKTKNVIEQISRSNLRMLRSMANNSDSYDDKALIDRLNNLSDSLEFKDNDEVTFKQFINSHDNSSFIGALSRGIEHYKYASPNKIKITISDCSSIDQFLDIIETTLTDNEIIKSINDIRGIGELNIYKFLNSIQRYYPELIDNKEDRMRLLRIIYGKNKIPSEINNLMIDSINFFDLEKSLGHEYIGDIYFHTDALTGIIKFNSGRFGLTIPIDGIIVNRKYLNIIFIREIVDAVNKNELVIDVLKSYYKDGRSSLNIK